MHLPVCHFSTKKWSESTLANNYQEQNITESLQHCIEHIFRFLSMGHFLGAQCVEIGVIVLFGKAS